VLSVKKNRLISRNLSLDGLSEGPMNRGNPPIPGGSCMELSQNLPDRYSVAQLTQHGTKVQKMVQRWTVGTNGSSGIRKGQRRCTKQRRAKRFHSDSRYHLHGHPLCATFVPSACCLFSLPYTLRSCGGFVHRTGASVNFS
jgi:hypothetical protein